MIGSEGAGQTPLDNMNRQDLNSLHRFAYDSLSDSIEIEDVSRTYGTKTITWRITAPGEGEYYLKRHEYPGHYLAEVRALNEWVQRLPDEPWWSVPKVLTTEDELGALIMTGLPGLILEEAPVEPTTRTKLFQLAGRFAKSLHSCRIDLSSEPTSHTYSEETLDRVLLAAEPHVDSATLKWVDSVVRRFDAWKGLAIVPTHCDFSPRNWLFCEGKTLLGIIDWERSRPGYYVEDFQRMIQDHWLLDPHLRDAFFAGYGREPSELEWYQANQVVLINAVGGVTWSISHGDPEFELLNRTVVERLKGVL